jgi:hypothetical protein
MALPSLRQPIAAIQPWDTQGSLLRRVVATGARLIRSIQPTAPEPAADDGVATPAKPAEPAAVPAPPPAPVFARSTWADRLWGEDMPLPGGSDEVLRLAALLPLAPAHTLLLAGFGARAAGGIVSGARGCFVAAHDLLPAPAAGPGRRPPPKRVTVAALAPERPAFRPAYHQHALLLEPFRHGSAPDQLLRATAGALRDGGEVVMFDLVARDTQTDARWLTLEDRRAPPPEAVMSGALERAGFRVHVVEDAGMRHQRAVLFGWASLLEALRHEPQRPRGPAAKALVTEAEAWLLRLRLLHQGRLRMLRWHATMVRRPG